jgi:hypothetical protein
MTELDKFLPHIMPYADSVPKEVVRQALVRTANSFYTRTLLWKENLDIDVKAGDWDVDIPVPENSYAVRIMDAWFGTDQLFESEFFMCHPSCLESEQPLKAYVFNQFNSIKLMASPKKDGVIKATVALAPTTDATELPDEAYNRFLEVIVRGTLADVFQMAGQPWSNPQLSAGYLQFFIQGVREGRVEADRRCGRNTGFIKPLRIV